ncbi:MAG: hypothetical protein Fur005_21240 [Roseiflexaceae bacterium]
MRSIIQAFQYAGFVLYEYARSGRMLIEVLATAACMLVFFRPQVTPPTPEYFLTIAGVFSLGICLYSASAIFTLGDRITSYLALAHGLRRSSFLLGLYLSIVLLAAASYGLLCLAIAVINPVAGLDIRGWVMGSIPLLLNVTMLAALLTLLTPMVLSAGWRLLTLAFVALAFSGNLITGPTMAALPAPVATTLDVLRTIFSAPLLPAFTGFAVSVTRDYSNGSLLTPVAQAVMTIVLLVVAVRVFRRREVFFTQMA